MAKKNALTVCVTCRRVGTDPQAPRDGVRLSDALAARGAKLAEGWSGSLTMGAGQFCTNPGLLVMPKGVLADAFAKAAGDIVAKSAPQIMLTDGIAEAYRAGANRAAGIATPIFEGVSEGRNALPSIYKTTAEEFLRDNTLAEEVFGPLGIIVTVSDDQQMLDVALAMEGQLTATLHMDDGDTDLARRLMPILEQKAGRILANGWPTGVEVADAMVHGGPYPASTNFGATSVGTMAIRRFLRPVSYQNIPEALLPEDLRGL